MSNLFKLVAAGVVLLLGLSTQVPGAVAAAPSVSSASDPVVIPFEPPLGRPIRYRRTKEVVDNGRTFKAWSEIELVFSRREDGFRAAVRTLDGGVENQPRAVEQAYREISRDFERPHVLLLDETGLIVGLENEEAFWAETMRVTEAAIRRGRDVDDAEGRAMLAQAMGMVADMPREARLSMLTEAVAPVVEFAAAELTPGVPLSSAIEFPSPFGGTATMQMEIRADRVAGGHVFISTRGSMDREALLQAVERAFERIPITGRGENTEEARARGMQQLREGDFTRELVVTDEIELATGLLTRHRSVDSVRVRTSAEARSKRTSVTLERVD